MLLLGPPRSGKGRNVVIPMILDDARGRRDDVDSL